ncbi:MAG: hypothetical protein FJ090_08660 [Deltaproteobacteria bacterium]|nr:hypothetical protein [Deltaproteobacteria bacterium]
MVTLVLLALSAAAGQDGVYDLPDAGVRLLLPTWHMSRWSDWDFRGRTSDGAVLVAAWYTPFQASITAANAEGLRAAWKAKLEEEDRASNVSFTTSDVVTLEGRSTLRATATMDLPGGTRAVFEGAAFATDGRTFQVATYAAAQNGRRATMALERILHDLAVTNPPETIDDSGKLEHEFFSFDLPEGWRVPLKSEEFDTSYLYSQTGAMDTSECVAAIRPVAPGDTDLLLACPGGPHLSIVDQYSFEDEATVFRSALFGKAASTLAPASLVDTRSGVAILQKVNDGLYVTGLPYRDGTFVAWVAGEKGRDAEIGASAKAIDETWTLASDAQVHHPLGAVVIHTLAYRPTHPFVLGAAALMLGILGLFAKLIFSRSRMEIPQEY